MWSLKDDTEDYDSNKAEENLELWLFISSIYPNFN